MNKIIALAYAVLFFILPFVFFPKSSELFEFNKMITVYIFTIIIAAIWGTKMVLEKKFVFRKTLLDLPLVIFLSAMMLSTVFSIDTHTSLFGYYSRFNGGLISSICYSLLYWAYVSNIDSKTNLGLIKIFLFSSVVIGIYATLEHFGHSPSCLLLNRNFNADCWIQDVQTRVFATLGQPNWLGTWIAGLLPLTWALVLKDKLKSKNTIVWGLASILLFLTLLFTKSRSAFLGFGMSVVVFWVLTFVIYLKQKINFKQICIVFLILNSTFLILNSLIDTPWTPSLLRGFGQQTQQKQASTDTALETGGTESGEIRKIVWRGAIDLWKHYPILGTGVETFAYSYYEFRPKEHNLVSEWDFLYNKAHNEYLNFAATTGSVGLITYLLLIASALYQIFKSRSPMSFALLAGFIAILVSNFFGFSVVITNVQLLLYPAMAYALRQEGEKVKRVETQYLTTYQKTGIVFIALFTLLPFYLICRYWYSDYLYAFGKRFEQTSDYTKAAEYFLKATALSPNEALYRAQLAQTYTSIAQKYAAEANVKLTDEFVQKIIREVNLANQLSPRNVSLQKIRSNIFVDLGSINPDYILGSIQTLEKLKNYAPTDPQVFYKLGLAYANAGQRQEAIKNTSIAVDLKSNYKNPRMLLAVIYKTENKLPEAKLQLNYILKNIDSKDEWSKKELEGL